jgi:stage II sporulation protein D
MFDLRWLAALLISSHLVGTGIRSKIVRLSECRPYLTGSQPMRVGLAVRAQRVSLVCARSAQVDIAGRTLPWDAGQPLEVHVQAGDVSFDRGDKQFRAPSLSFRPGRGGTTRVICDGSPPVDAQYPGEIEVSASRSGATVVNVIGLESYLRGVVPAEMPASFPMEALKAQAIAARTYALYQRDAHRAEGFDLCSGVHCQAYRGAADHARTNAAIRATAGEVVAYGDVLVKTVYHSTCGGSTDDGWKVWWGHALPYLRARPDAAWCSRSPKYRWRREIGWQEVERSVEQNLGAVCFKPGAAVGRLLDLRIEERTSAGRARRLLVVGDTGQETVVGDSIRWLLGVGKPGPGGLNSTFSTLSIENKADGNLARLVFEGRGWGHGLGMCQMGAAGRARAGQKAESILRWYYQGARVVAVR